MSYIQGNVGTPFIQSVGRGMVLQFDSPVQGGDVHVVGGRQVLAGSSAVSRDGVPSLSHHTEHTPSTQVSATLTQNPIQP